MDGLVTEGDLRELVGNLGVATREPEREGWQQVVAKGNDDVSYRVWCDKPMVALSPPVLVESIDLVLYCCGSLEMFYCFILLLVNGNVLMICFLS